MNFVRSKVGRRSLWGAAGLFLGGWGLLSLQSGDNLVTMATVDPRNLGQSERKIDFEFINAKRAKMQLKSRADHIKEIEDNPEYDVVIIGGGCTGGGVVLNTSAAGLRTLLIEAYDFSAGTSSKSTKLLHGGNFPSMQAIGTSSRSSNLTSSSISRRRTIIWSKRALRREM